MHRPNATIFSKLSPYKSRVISSRCPLSLRGFTTKAPAHSHRLSRQKAIQSGTGMPSRELGKVGLFAVAAVSYLITDAILYKGDFKYVKSNVWRHVLHDGKRDDGAGGAGSS